MPPPFPKVYVPFFPATSPYALPYEMFDQLILARGIRIAWAKNHSCPCVYGGPTPGAPDPQCVTCGGRGVYWDALSPAFTGLITLIHTSPTPDEPGSIMDEDQGLIINGEPALTIPYSAGSPWQEASVFDLFVEIDAINRMQVELVKAKREVIPYPQILTVAASGAVTVYDTTTHQVVSGVSYTVSGQSVVLSSAYASGTPYIVDFTCAPTYVAYRIAGAPAHVRPFSQITEPRRFRLQQLDLWTRQRYAGDIPSA